jgi:hypothetical protein
MNCDRCVPLLALAALLAAPQLRAEGMSMSGVYGQYAMTREASGTSWQPDASGLDGRMRHSGEWMLMSHGFVSAIYDRQGGARGAEQLFFTSMFMGMGQRTVGESGRIGLRAMLSLDPLMGARGYPLLFAAGETADGRNVLLDRQHPHDLFMELSAAYARDLAPGTSLFVYCGLPGEPALGPPAFMHRAAAFGNPEAPLAHHWLDSTHISFGVVTLGAIRRAAKLEFSVFNAREPDQHRYDIETGPLDSWSARASWNPAPQWSLQVSHGALEAPEQLEPTARVARSTASVAWQPRPGRQLLLAFGRNAQSDPGLAAPHTHASDAWLLEGSLRLTPQWQGFARVERIEPQHLPGTGGVAKLSVGLARDLRAAGAVMFSAGALASAYAVPRELRATYGSSPVSAMLYVSARIQP